MFNTVVTNALAGKRGAALFGDAATTNMDKRLSPLISYANRQKLKE